MMTDGPSAGRALLRVSGGDRHKFMQGLVTNDVGRMDRGLVYAALLTPQGKYLADFFLFERDEAIWIDVAADLAADLARRLSMYRLRADVQIETAEMVVRRGTGPTPDGAMRDPRHEALGWRAYAPAAEAGRLPDDDDTDWDALRVAHCIPQTGVELIPGETYILEAGFERLGGVDFRKGCYVGQEVTARMKHKTELRKGLVTVAIEGHAPVGTEITVEGRPAGKLFTAAGDRAIAHLRFDRAAPGMQAGAARLTPLPGSLPTGS